MPHPGFLAGRLGEDFRVYYCIDDYAAHPGVDAEHIGRRDAALCRDADLVFVAPPTLVEAKRALNPRTVFSPHGVDADLFARGLLHVVAEWPVLGVLLVLFGAAALLTQILSDAATTVLLAPIAISLAGSLGLPPTPFVVCTALGAVVAFLTPIGHHGNLLILGPGQYRFGDFLLVGLPLTALVAFVSAWLARWLWLAGPLLPTFAG